MKYFSFCKEKLHGSHAAVLMAILLLIGMFHFMVYNHQKEMIDDELAKIDREYDEIKWYDIEAAIKLTKEAARVRAVHSANDIIADIQNTYSDLTILQQEVDKVGLGSPELIKILHRNLAGRYMYDNKTYNNSMFVISKLGIVYNQNIETLDRVTRSFSEEANTHFNGKLMYTALDALIAHKDENLIYYEPDDPQVQGHIMITSPTRNDMKDVFMREGLDGLKGYIILVPAYITDDGDVFGVPDISENGQRNHNHKMIVVQQFSIYDVMQKIYLSSEMKDKAHYVSREAVVDYMSFSNLAYLAGMILDIIAILFLLLYATVDKNDTKQS